MSRKVTVLLLEDIQSLGKAGDIVTVSEGHARNLLFPQGKAALADAKARSRAQAEQAHAVAATAKELEELQALAERLEGTELTLTAKPKKVAGPEKSEADLGASNEIFGSITAQQIVAELNREASLSLKPKDVKLGKPITHLGSEDVAVRLSPEIETHIRVTILPHEKT